MLPEEQTQYADDVRACQEQSGMDAGDGELTDEELARLYEFELETVACLEERGYDFDPPSQQDYIDRYRDGDPWTAFAENAPYPRDEYLELTTDCPQAADRFAW